MNKEKLVTIIFPSRNRYELTKNLLLSIEEKTHNKDWIEVISICDHDDKETLDLFHEISSQITYDFKFISRKQKKELDLPNDYYDLGLKLSSDSYFTWILGNDCKIVSNQWDINFYKSISFSISDIFSNIEENNQYYYFRINDDTHWDKEGNSIQEHGDQSCCFPLISSNYCRDLKEFYPTEIPVWGGDTCLYNIFSKSNVSLIVDAVDIIQIEHYSPHNHRVEEDNISIQVKTRYETLRGSDGLHWWNKPENIIDMLQKRKKYLWRK